jgi:hypothetical protein
MIYLVDLNNLREYLLDSQFDLGQLASEFQISWLYFHAVFVYSIPISFPFRVCIVKQIKIFFLLFAFEVEFCLP